MPDERPVIAIADRHAGAAGDAAVGVRQRVQRDLEHQAQPLRLEERAGADRFADLRAVVPHLGELAADVEPERRPRFARP